MLDPEVKDELDAQLQTCRRLLTSPDWIVWVKFLKQDRRGYLQNKINQAVKDGELVQAQIMLALQEDCLRQIELFGNFIKKTESELGDKK